MEAVGLCGWSMDSNSLFIYFFLIVFVFIATSAGLLAGQRSESDGVLIRYCVIVMLMQDVGKERSSHPLCVEVVCKMETEGDALGLYNTEKMAGDVARPLALGAVDVFARVQDKLLIA